MMAAPQSPATVAIAGLGSVGRVVAEHLSDRERYVLTAVSARNVDRAKTFLLEQGSDAAVVSLNEIASHADIVIECAPAAHFRTIAGPVVAAGKTLVTLSVGALLDAWNLVDEAGRAGARILVPTGALVGLDAVQAAAVGHINSVRMTTRKPVAGLRDSPFVLESGIDLSQLDEPRLLFSGTAREAIVGFPANLNVVVALALAGVGPDRTEMEVWADPDLTLNTHRIVVDAAAVQLDLTIRNVPSENPATGRLTALSVVALLDKLTATLRIGT